MALDQDSKLADIEARAEKRRDDIFKKRDSDASEIGRRQEADRRARERALQAADRTERKLLEGRLDKYREYYNILRQLNFDSARSFVLSAINATNSYLQQLALREAADRAYDEYKKARALGDSVSAALSLGTSAAIPGFAIAGALALGGGLLTSILSYNNNDDRRDPNRIFHRRNNDAMLRNAVTVGASNRALAELDQQQQVSDIGKAVVEGVGQVLVNNPQQMRGDVTINLQITDRTLQTMKVRLDDLDDQGRLD